MNKIQKTWITDGITEDAIEWAENLGNELSRGDKLSTSQLRKFFDSLKRIQLKGFNNGKQDLLLLKPKLAYALGRARSKDKRAVPKYEKFNSQIGEGISYVENDEHFKNFVNLVEAVVAYHKAGGGE